MSLIPQVGRKVWSVRLFIAFVYISLTLMGSTMVIPFLITVSGSTSNAYDNERFWPVPRFIWSEKDRFMRSMAPYFNDFKGWREQLSCNMNGIPTHWSTWSAIGLDIKSADARAAEYLALEEAEPDAMRVRAADYSLFAMDYPLTDSIVGFDLKDKVPYLQSLYGKKFTEENPEKAKGLSSKNLAKQGLLLLSDEWDTPFESFYDIGFRSELYAPIDQQGWFPPNLIPKYAAFLKLKTAYRNHMFSPGVEKQWKRWLAESDDGIQNQDSIYPVTDSSSPELQEQWRDFLATRLPCSPVMPYALRAQWYKFLESEEVGLSLGLTSDFSIDDYNRLAGTEYDCLYATPFPVPESYAEEIRDIWKRFVLNRYPLRLTTITLDDGIQEKYQKFIQEQVKYLRVANRLFKTTADSWDFFKFTPIPPSGDEEYQRNIRNIWRNFVRERIPMENRKITSSEIAYQKFLLQKYGSLQKINEVYHWDLNIIEEAFPPFMDAYTITFKNNQKAMTWYPVRDNYATVLSFLMFNGRAIPVTIVLIVMTLICTLTINPLAAYALSRFTIRGQDKILLFMLATMAFPAMVSAIPAYLLMRDLGLLNTFFALVLPGAANGMAIFILKGFFDSLPSELYEAATIDGAREMQIFRIVAMPMVKPILAINALNAFVAAYAGWAWALIICQDKSMWTISVWLYQISQAWGRTPWLITAGFVVASVPTAIAFLSCQKIILKGIILPSMK